MDTPALPRRRHWYLVKGLLVGGCAGWALGFGGLHAPPIASFCRGAFFGLWIGLFIDIFRTRCPEPFRTALAIVWFYLFFLVGSF